MRRHKARKLIYEEADSLDILASELTDIAERLRLIASEVFIAPVSARRGEISHLKWVLERQELSTIHKRFDKLINELTPIQDGLSYYRGWP